MMTEVYETESPEETRALGETLAKNALPGQIVLLEGDLGVGKTVFTQGFAKGLGITENVVSPTFTLLQIYESGRLPLYHFDMYRIEDPDEIYEIGCEDYFYGDGVSFIEWPSRLADSVPKKATRVTITKEISRGTDYRRITICRDGSPNP